MIAENAIKNKWLPYISWLLRFIFFAYSCSIAVAQSSQETPNSVIEIRKYYSPDGNGYFVTLVKDGTVSFTTAYGHHIIKRSNRLSQQEFDGVLALIDKGRVPELGALSLDAYLALGGTLADIVVFREGQSIKWHVDGRSVAQLKLFQEFESRLKIENMRCPSVISLGGKDVDMCVVEAERRRKLQQGKKND